jgi:hypothetical protein
MTDRQLLQQALDALTCNGEDDDPGHRCAHCDDYVDRNGPLRAALRYRLAQCDRCGKRLGGEGHIHTCTPLEQKSFEQWWDAGDDIPNNAPYTPDTPIQFAWAGWQAALAQPKQEGDIHTCTPDPIGDAQDRLIAEMAAQPEQEPVACLSKTQAKAILGLALDLEKTGRMVVITQGQERTDFVARNRNIQCALEDALRNATTPPAAPVQEPVALIRTWHKHGDQHAELVDWGMALQFLPDGEHCLYATPPAAAQRTWVGLTDEEELQLASLMDKSRHWLVWQVEAKLKEKNT